MTMENAYYKLLSQFYILRITILLVLFLTGFVYSPMFLVTGIGCIYSLLKIRTYQNDIKKYLMQKMLEQMAQHQEEE